MPLLHNNLELERRFFIGCPKFLTIFFFLLCGSQCFLTELFFLSHTASFSISTVIFQCNTLFFLPSHLLKYLWSLQSFLPFRLVTLFCLYEKNYMYLKSFWGLTSTSLVVVNLSCLNSKHCFSLSCTEGWTAKTESVYSPVSLVSFQTSDGFWSKKSQVGQRNCLNYCLKHVNSMLHVTYIWWRG